MDNNFNMTFEESQDYIAKRGFDIPWNDCDVFVDEREINRTVGNVLKWADKTMIEKACEWIIENMPHYVSKDYTYEVDMADDFRKAMEE
jgi:hypothetical protein